MSAAGERETERAVRARGLNAPRISPDDLDAKITAEMYHVAGGPLTWP